MFILLLRISVVYSNAMAIGCGHPAEFVHVLSLYRRMCSFFPPNICTGAILNH